MNRLKGLHTFFGNDTHQMNHCFKCAVRMSLTKRTLHTAEVGYVGSNAFGSGNVCSAPGNGKYGVPMCNQLCNHGPPDKTRCPSNQNVHGIYCFMTACRSSSISFNH